MPVRDYYVCYEISGVATKQSAGPFGTEAEAEGYQAALSNVKGVFGIYVKAVQKFVQKL